MKINTKLLFLFAILVFADQLSKYLSFDSICNQNIAWSISLSPAIFCLVWTAIIAILIYLFLKNKFYIQKLFVILVIAGALSNMIDRIRLGCVVDYIDLKFWPVFNLADVYITVGIFFLIILNLKFKILNES